MADNVYIKRLNVIDSTNRYARDEARTLWDEAKGDNIIAITARWQTAGRGQRGSTWHSKADSNLLLTLLVRPGDSLKVTEQFRLSQAAALALHKAMMCYGIETRLKWPNDIYVGKRKLAGILLELDYTGLFVEQATIGIGLNINQCEFPIMDKEPVSMKMLLKETLDVDSVLHNILESFKEHYCALKECDAAIATEYGRLLMGAGEECRFTDSTGEFTAVIEGVEPDGRLVLRTSDGSTRSYAFKEIEMRL